MERMAYSRLTPAAIWTRQCAKSGRSLPGYLWLCGHSSSQYDPKQPISSPFPARRSIESSKKEAVGESLALVARRLSMLFFYLPVIIFEAWMLSPPKRRTNEPDASARL